MDFKTLREKYPEFSYKSYTATPDGSDLKIKFKFVSSELEFNPEIKIKGLNNQVDIQKFENLIFHLGLIEMFSYWKATCSQKILIEAGFLDMTQITWWKEILLKGMGQYFFENSIDFTAADFVEIESIGNKHSEKITTDGEKALIPVGGGKDSVVTLDLLSREYKDVAAFALYDIAAIKNVIEISGVNFIQVERSIDPLLLDLNQKGYLNGHTPFSAYLAFLATLCASLFGYKYIAISNERSSNESNTDYLGHPINHQYSKTVEFERKFGEYNQSYLSNTLYFSFVRPLHEIQIAKLFSKLNQYFNAVRSCNVGQKTNSWCGKCPKCLSTFILLYPFMETKAVSVFGVKMFEMEDLKPVIDQLLDEDKVKPFECVGTRRELRIALYLAWTMHSNSTKPMLLSYADEKLDFSKPSWAEDAKKIMDEWNEENFLPDKFAAILKKAYE